MALGGQYDSLELDDLEYTMLVDNPTGILVVDDEDVICTVFEALFEGSGYQVAYAGTAGQAYDLAGQDDQLNLLIVDKNLPDFSGLELMRRVQQVRPGAGFIMITGYASYESAIEALRLGAYDYLEKPFSDLGLVREKVDLALDRLRLMRENEVLAEQLRSVHKDLRSKQAALELRTEAADTRQVQRLTDLQARLDLLAGRLLQAISQCTTWLETRKVPSKQILEHRQHLEAIWASLRNGDPKS